MKVILSPELGLTDQPYFWLKDLKDMASYKVVEQNPQTGNKVYISEADLERLISMRNALKSESHTFWDIVSLVNSSVAVNPSSGVYDIEAWIYADASILSTPLPEGLPNRLQEDEVTVNTWQEWVDTWSSSIHYSLDETKVIIPTNVNNQYLSKDEIMTLKDFVDNDATHNSEICNNVRVKELQSSVEFASEEI